MARDETELDALMDRLADGDRTAFEPLYAVLRPRAVRFARARLGVERAEDAAQATLLRVFSRASEFERGRAVLPWFYAIAANEIRAIARRDRIPAPPLESATVIDPETELCEREVARAVERALADLDEDSAEAILASLDHGPRPNVPASTFRKRVSRAYVRLRKLLGVHGV